jgi:septin 7
MKVREKKQKMKNSELELKNKNEQMRASIEQQERELKDRRKAFENEVLQWEQTYGISLDDVRRLSLESNSKETIEKKKKKGLF